MGAPFDGTEGKYIDPAWVDGLTAIIANPTGVWADYNYVLEYWRRLHDLVEQCVIPETLLPPKPNVSDYPDLTSSRTLD